MPEDNDKELLAFTREIRAFQLRLEVLHARLLPIHNFEDPDAINWDGLTAALDDTRRVAALVKGDVLHIQTWNRQ